MTPTVISPAQTLVLLALIRVWQRDGRATVRSLCCEASCNVSTAHAHLKRLRCAGLVAWEPPKEGTLRPLVAPVAVLDGAR